MGIDLRSRVLALGLPAIALGVALGGCDYIPDDGYDKVASRERGDGPVAAAPAPPPYVAGVGGGGSTVPQLAAGAPAGVDQAMVEAGAQQFGTVCAACHGAGGAGTGAGPQLSDAEWLNIDGSYDEIVAVITNGVAAPKQFPAPMPARGGGPFNDEQVRQLAAYVFALSHQAGS